MIVTPELTVGLCSGIVGIVIGFLTQLAFMKNQYISLDSCKCIREDCKELRKTGLGTLKATMEALSRRVDEHEASRLQMAIDITDIKVLLSAIGQKLGIGSAP